ncbi:MAG: peptidylprolyl isomerase [Bacterioplanes sp.]|nr:peptidylprolyl isomerase [Bacterioplanes sp.]
MIRAFMIAIFMVVNTLALAEQPASTSHVNVEITTTLGVIELQLDAEKAPLSVANFVAYIEDQHYDNTVFHRVINNFMIQGGGFDTNMRQKATRAPIKNEAQNGLKNVRGSIAMARTGVVDSATSQFFINLKDNAFLDHGARDFGYAVFGQVTSGMDVVDRIATQPTNRRDEPTTPIIIQSVRMID